VNTAPRIVRSVELALPESAQVRAAAFVDGLHLFAATEPLSTSVHRVIDASAREIARLPDLDLCVAHAAGGDAGLLVSGDDAAGRLVLAAIDASGREQWRARLHAQAPLTRAPQPLVAGGRAAVIWEESDDERSVLVVCNVQAHACDAARQIVLQGTTHRIDAVMTPAGIVLARLAGFPPRLMLMRITSADAVDTCDVPEAGAGPVALARVGHDIALAWAVGDQVHVRVFDAQLKPSSPASTQFIASGIVDRLSGHGGERAAFVATHWHGKPAPRGHPSVMRGASQVWLDGAACDVPLPIGAVEAGGWIDDTFVLVHGDRTIAASAFAHA
jgi:hypothetical protein